MRFQGRSFCVGVRETKFDKHSSFTDRAHRSADAFKFGLRGAEYGNPCRLSRSTYRTQQKCPQDSLMALREWRCEPFAPLFAIGNH
jgi:hypothetical protein